MKSISSTSNPQFRQWRSLLTSKGVKSEGLFLLSGEKLIREFLKRPTHRLHAELIKKGQDPLQSQAPAFELAPALFRELDIVNTHFNLLVLETEALPPSSPRDPVQSLEVIAPLGDPANLGALIRSCVAFGVSKIHLTQESANPYHPRCVKASAGALLKAPLFQSGSLPEWDHQTVWALDSKGESLLKVEWPSQVRVLIGEEGPGLPELLNVHRVSIPTEDVESLNATVAASLVLWHLKTTHDRR